MVKIKTNGYRTKYPLGWRRPRAFEYRVFYAIPLPTPPILLYPCPSQRLLKGVHLGSFSLPSNFSFPRSFSKTSQSHSPLSSPSHLGAHLSLVSRSNPLRSPLFCSFLHEFLFLLAIRYFLCGFYVLRLFLS